MRKTLRRCGMAEAVPWQLPVSRGIWGGEKQRPTVLGAAVGGERPSDLDLRTGQGPPDALLLAVRKVWSTVGGHPGGALGFQSS